MDRALSTSLRALLAVVASCAQPPAVVAAPTSGAPASIATTAPAPEPAASASPSSDAGPVPVLVTCNCEGTCVSRPAPTDRERYDACIAQPEVGFCNDEDPCPPGTCLRGVAAGTDGGPGSCPPVAGRPQFFHVEGPTCTLPQGDPAHRTVTPDVKQCSIRVVGAADLTPMRHALQKRSWLPCIEDSLKTSAALAGQRVKIATSLDRNGQPAFVTVEGVGDEAVTACIREAVTQDLQGIAARMAGGVTQGASMWMLSQK